MNDLNITLFQSDTIWHNINENLQHIETILKQNDPQTDLIILPEMFNTGFTMHPDRVSEDMNGLTVNFLRRTAKIYNADIAGSIAIKENGFYYNRLLWIKPDGTVFTYDKRHLFRMAGEDKIYSPGNSKLIVNLNGWKIAPFICYDLRFPVWSRNYKNGYDVAVFTANWPAARDNHWDALLRARAIENQCYAAGINRSGKDGNEISYSGRSAVIDFYGTTIFQADENECLKTVTLSYDALTSYRNSFPAWMDSDKFEIL